MEDIINQLNELDNNYQNFSLSQYIEQMNSIFESANSLADIYTEKKKTEKLSAVEFYSLWTDFFSFYLVWSGEFNRFIRKQIEENRENNVLVFQKYCYLYQYWWLSFHLITKHFTNYRRERIIILEDELKKKIEVISERLKATEVIDRFEKKDFDYLLNLEKMN